MKKPSVNSDLRSLDLLLHAAGLGIALLIAGIAQWGILRPLDRELAEGRREYAHLGRLIERGPQVRQEHAKLEARLEELQAETATLRKLVPDEAGEGEFLRMVTEMADSVDLRLREYRPGGVTEHERYRRMSIALNCDGRYDSICRFCDLIARLPRLVMVSRLEIFSKSRDETYPVRVTLDIYFLEEQTEDPPGGEHHA